MSFKSILALEDGSIFYGALAKGGEEVDQPGVMDSHPMGRSMMVPKPPQ